MIKLSRKGRRVNGSATLKKLVNKDLVEPQLWNRLVARITQETRYEPSLAERIMDQAIGFLRLCAESAHASYSPSPIVDIGWHTFLLYTREYADFCDRVAGRFIHHVPSDEEDASCRGGSVAETVAAMRRSKIAVIEAMWTGSASCDNGVSCANNCRGH